MYHVIQNIVLGISLAAPIGPANIAIIKKGLKRGFFPALLVGSGVITADIAYLLIIYFGLSSFIAIPIVKILIWLLGSAILLFLGYQSIKEYSTKTKLNRFRKIFHSNSFIEGFMVNISNPITILWWVGIFGSVLGLSIQNTLKNKGFVK